MKKILIVSLSLVFLFTLGVGTLFASPIATPPPPAAGTQAGITIPSQPGMVIQTIDWIIDWMFWILIIAAVIMIILAAFTFLGSAGEAEKVSKARNMIVYALLALLVAFMARALVNWLMAQLGYGVVV